ncbi:MAG: fibronectin type III domain-containing protein [Solirubrobacterales bacterium]
MSLRRTTAEQTHLSVSLGPRRLATLPLAALSAVALVACTVLLTPAPATATQPAVEGLTTEPATNLQRTSADLHGSFTGDGEDTNYYFEYVTQEQFEQAINGGFAEATATATLDAGSPALGEPATENFELTGLSTQTAYRYRIVAEDGAGKSVAESVPLITVANVIGVEDEPATVLSTESVVLHGSFTGDGNETHYYFEYGTDSAYGHQTAPESYSGSAQHSFSTEVTGLTPHNTYHFRLVATNKFGTTTTEDRSIETPEPPTVVGLTSENLTATGADLLAKVNPQGSATTVHFEYGTTTGYGASPPIPEQSIGSGSADKSLKVHLTELQPHATYHFRLTATSKWGTTTTEDQSFNFYPANCPNAAVRQQTNSGFLPDCRAYELVSPGDAGDAVLFPGTANGGFYGGAPDAPYAENPARFAFAGWLGAIPGTDSPNGSTPDTYVSTRTDTGWVTRYVGILGDEHLGATPFWGETEFTDPSMDKLLDFESYKEPGGNEIRIAAGREFFEADQPPYLWDANGASLGRWPADSTGLTSGAEVDSEYQPSPDFTHLAFSSNNLDFTVGQAGEEGLTTAPGSAYDYDVATEKTTLISKTPGGENIPQEPGDAAETNERIEFPNATFVGQPDQDHPSVSTDGSHILMSTLSSPFQPFGEGSYQGPLTRLYMRVNDAVTYEVSQGKDVRYVGMTADGTKVFFTSEEQLTSEDHDHSTDLYMWSEEGEEAHNPLTLISKGNTNGGLGNGDDCHPAVSTASNGSALVEMPWTEKCDVVPMTDGIPFHFNEPATTTDSAIAAKTGEIYFFSPEQLDGAKGVTGLENLYNYRDGRLQFVATFEPDIECSNNSQVCRDAPASRFEVTPDGTHAAFLSRSQLTSYDNEAASHQCGQTFVYKATLGARCEEMYTYAPATGKIVCASCNPDGARPTADVEASTQGLFLSNDGRAFFDTVDPLVQADTNGVGDVYEYVDGRPQLITTGTNSADLAGNTANSAFAGLTGGLAGVSANGVNVYFSTRDSLVPQDRNGEYLKFYDARSDGGFATEVPPAHCEAADECHGAGSSPPILSRNGTGPSLGSGGNATSNPQTKHHKKKHRRAKHKRHGHRANVKRRATR